MHLHLLLLKKVGMVFRGTCNSAGGIKVKSKKEMGGRVQNHGGEASARRG